MPQMIAFLIILNLVFCIDLKNRLVSIAIVFTTVVIGFLVAFNTTGNAASWTMDFYRLVFPIFMTTCLWLIVKCIESSDTKRFLGCQFMACVGLLVFFWPQAEATSQELQVQMEVLKLQEHGFKFQASPLQSYYKDLQNLVPAGEKIFAIVDAPYLLDYSRNPIFNVDNIACASPPPGMPFNKGAPALEEYLRNLGIKYLLAVDFNKAIFLYNRQVMENHPRSEFRDFSKSFIVDFFNNIDTLAQGNIIAKNANSRLIWIASE
jgi:4-amino-4-deoxy-L-arabinose transferase-like glycosyltransferase